MTIDQLLATIHLVRRLHRADGITRGQVAEELKVTPAKLTRDVRAVEKAWNVELVLRRGRKLLPAGVELAMTGEAFEQSYESLAELIRLSDHPTATN